MRIYCVGAHSTGKTTLARHISQTYKMPMLSEVARAVLAEKEIPLARLRSDVSLVNEYQKEVLYRQIETEYSRGDNFVSDRACDAVAYAAEHSTITKSLIDDRKFQDYVNWVAQGVVFFVRPHKELLTVDNVRENPTWEGILRIDGMIKLLLEMYGIKYTVVAPLSAQERVNLVECILSTQR